MANTTGKFSLKLGLKKRGPSRMPDSPRRPAAGGSRQRAVGATRSAAVGKAPSERNTAWLNRVLILLGAGVVLVAATKAYITVQSIPVQHISVTGLLERSQAQAVQDLVQTSLAGGFLNADLQLIRAELEGLPWIFETTVRRKWPNALEIHVVKQLPIARWGEHELLNHQGGVFRAAKSDELESLPLLNGPPGSAAALMAKYQRLVEILSPLNLQVAQLSLDERGQLEAGLVGGMRLILGGEDFLGRLQRFVTIYRSELVARRGEIERVDLRYETGVAVAFSPEQHLSGL